MSKPIKIVTILGSARPNNLTSKALHVVINEFKKYAHISLEMVDPRELSLSLPGKNVDNDSSKLIQSIVSRADGILLSTPEYHGSYSSVIKLIIDNLDGASFSGKPIALLGVAAGGIGAIKSLEHLRSICSHLGAIVLPKAVSVANADKIFDSEGRCLDEILEQRLCGLAKSLVEYIEKHKNS